MVQLVRNSLTAIIDDKTGLSINIKPHHEELVRNLYRISSDYPSCGAKIYAIKFFRYEYNIELMDSKNICDAIGNDCAGNSGYRSI